MDYFVKTYQKKTGKINGVKLERGNINNVALWTNGHVVLNSDGENPYGVVIGTGMSIVMCAMGDYVVQNSDGVHFTVWSRNDFENVYEEVR